MKVAGAIGTIAVMALLVGTWMGIFPQSALAADPAWRPTYDTAMRWLNFIILVAVIVKYAREPIKNFLKLKKKDVVEQLAELDREKTNILEQIKAAEAQGDENQLRFKELKERMIAQGETRKQQIIAQAKQQSAMMLEVSRLKMENRVVQAKAQLKMELLDLAIAQAIDKLPGVMTEDDNQRLLDDYMQRIHT